MSIQYKMMGMNDNVNPTDKKKTGYYPTVVRRKTIGIAEVADIASAHCSMNNFELEMAAKVLIKTIKTELLNSNHLCLEGFGTFSLKAGSRIVQNPTELRAESIYVKKVAFKHSPILVNEMKKATFEKFYGVNYPNKLLCGRAMETLANLHISITVAPLSRKL